MQSCRRLEQNLEFSPSPISALFCCFESRVTIFRRPMHRSLPSTSNNSVHGAPGKDRAPKASTAAASAQTATSGGLAVASLSKGPTFSQAFESIDDTAHFAMQRAEVIATSATIINSQEERDRAAQRVFDQQEKSTLVSIPDTTSDRDHHILLQPHVLYVSTRQRGNGVLKHIRNVPYAFSKMVPDYILSSTRCALFLSIKYHQLYPNYIHLRLGELRTDFALRLLLVLVDVEDNANALHVLNILAVKHNLTLILAWSELEVARYLETYKAFDGKDATIIQKREQTNFVDQIADILSAAKPLNKTDSAELLSHFKSLRKIIAASKDELALCTGIGPIKVQRLWDAFHKPFSKISAKRRKQHQLETERQQQVEQLQQQQQQQQQQEARSKGKALSSDLEIKGLADVDGKAGNQDCDDVECKGNSKLAQAEQKSAAR